MGDGNDNHQTAAATIAPNKRKLDVNDEQQSIKRRKNKAKREKKKKANKAQSKQGKIIKRGNNWVENCSNSFNRIPSNCAAPLTCVITRVEIEEEPLLPKGVVESSDEKGLGTEDRDAGEKMDKDAGISSSKSADSEDAAPVKSEMANIARPSQQFLTQYAKEKSPWEMQRTIQENEERKKLFIPVKRCSSANGETNWAKERKKNSKRPKSKYVHLPGGDNGDGITNPYPSALVPDKFWAQRNRLFSRYDEGIQIGGNDDPEMWYSVTPESIANHVAERMVGMIREKQFPNDESDKDAVDRRSIVILDVFCGCAGNSIAFARLNNFEKQDNGQQDPHVKVIAVDNSISRLKMAAHNAAVYGIGKKDIIFVHADAIEVLGQYSKGNRKRNDDKSGEGDDTKEENKAGYHTSTGYAMGGIELLPDNLDGVFLSPPWGGMDYGNEKGKSGFDVVSSITVETIAEETSQDDAGNEKNAETSMKTNGGELLTMAAEAVFDDPKQDGAIAYFVPRNTDGIVMGQCAVTSGISGCFEMEQNVVNGKVKTVTAYFGHSVTSLFEDTPSSA